LSEGNVAQERIDTSPKVSDEVEYTTCYMCAGRCGIKVHMQGGAIRYIEGNKVGPPQSLR
jgi:anaerobic selenocysteine-containing dehydrogenase